MSDKRFILITGCSTGIGRTCAMYLSDRGFDVIATVRKPADASSLEESSKGRVQTLLMDVTDRSSIESAMERVRAIVGTNGLHGLVNNAGVGVFGPIEFVTLDDWRRQMEVNFFGQIAVTQQCLPLLRNRVAHAGKGSARIVFISSIAGTIASPMLSPYSASKHAIDALTSAMRLELRTQSIQVSCIKPGAIESDIWDKGKGMADAIPAEHPSRALYGSLMDSAVKVALDAKEKAIPALVVARHVERCLTRKRAPARIIIGTDARLGAFFHWAAPTRLYDWVLARMFKIG